MRKHFHQQEDASLIGFELIVGDAPQDSKAASDTGQWQFRGKRVVAAMMDSLVADKRLQVATHVMVTGDSAGGVAALNNADFMLHRVRPLLSR